MKVHADTGGRSTVTLERYEDLLQVRALPDYDWVADNEVEVATDDLAELGIVQAQRRRTFELSSYLFDYQQWIVERALQRQRFAVFALTGTGKTPMQLEWALRVQALTAGRVVILAPNRVCAQTVAMAHQFYGELPIAHLDTTDALLAWLDSGDGLAVTNYEKVDTLHRNHGVGRWPVAGVVLDESSCLKGFGTRKFAIVEAFKGVAWKLCCTATPAPNQRTEFAQHAVFLDQVRSTTEYLTTYFVNRDGDWEFKPHAYEAWVANLASWAVFLRDPARWGFHGGDKPLPSLSELFDDVALGQEQMRRARAHEAGDQPSLFGATPGGITSRVKLAQISNGFEYHDGGLVDEFESLKPAEVARIANDVHGHEPVIVWVKYRHEADQLGRLIPDAAVLHGGVPAKKIDALVADFALAAPGAPRVLVAMQSMFSFGLNLQACRVQVFSTQDDSFEARFQAIRRSLRYGQERDVIVYTPLTQLDQAACQNTLNKAAVFEADSQALEDEMVARLRPVDTSEVRVIDTDPQPLIDQAVGTRWTAIHGDSIAHLPTMPDESIDLAVFSPPFAALYSYSKALGDMGNVRADAEFRLQWRWFAEALLPKMKAGRVVAIHCKEIIRFANTHGHRWCYDFPAELRQGMEDAGFHYHRRVTIWKNPQLEATRNKETSLLHVTALRDASNSYPQTGEYLMVFSAPGKNERPIVHDRDAWSFEWHTEVMNSIWPDEALRTGEAELLADDARLWVDAYHPDRSGSVWTGIRETDVLNADIAKETTDERHVCPLQLGLIERVVHLWSNPDELVFTPFLGVGSEAIVALRLGRRAYGVELKRSYFDTAVKYLQRTEAEADTVHTLPGMTKAQKRRRGAA